MRTATHRPGLRTARVKEAWVVKGYNERWFRRVGQTILSGALGLIVGAESLQAQPAAGPLDLPGQPGTQSSAPAGFPAERTGQVSGGLGRVLELHRRGDFESAAPLLQDALMHQSDLAPAERQQLGQLVQDNQQ